MFDECRLQSSTRTTINIRIIIVVIVQGHFCSFPLRLIRFKYGRKFVITHERDAYRLLNAGNVYTLNGRRYGRVVDNGQTCFDYRSSNIDTRIRERTEDNI